MDAMLFRARKFEFTFPRPAMVMGVLNVTPDSFSDGGQFLDGKAAVVHALELVDEGAEILDIGGESTRPGAAPVSETEELRRVIPIIEQLAARTPVPISIDTQKPAVARAALSAGASIINDIAANREDGAMWRIVAEAQAGYICMHMQGTPQTMQIEPRYADVVQEVDEFFAERMRRLKECGISAEQVLLDPGIGFGKTCEQNLALVSGIGRFGGHGRPLLVGVSRKSFLGKISGSDVNQRLPAALACSILARAAGVAVFRAHDVADTVQALRAADAVLANKKP